MSEHEELDRLISRLVARDAMSAEDALDPDAQLAGRLIAMAGAVPESENKMAIRRDVLSVHPSAPRFRRRAWWVAIVAAASLAFSGVAVASRKALPGDALYPLKRAFSAVSVAASFSRGSHAGALLDRAEGALNDAKTLASEHKTHREVEALKVFEGDLSDARSEIARLTGSDQIRLNNRADDLERQASGLRDSVLLIPQGRSTVTPDEEQGGQSEGPFVQKPTKTNDNGGSNDNGSSNDNGGSKETTSPTQSPESDHASPAPQQSGGGDTGNNAPPNGGGDGGGGGDGAAGGGGDGASGGGGD